jgi:hypothetical protein
MLLQHGGRIVMSHQLFDGATDAQDDRSLRRPAENGRLRQAEGSPRPNILRRAPDQRPKLTCLRHPRLLIVVPVRQRFAVERQRHRRCFARLYGDLREAL